MISMAELLQGKKLEEQKIDVQANLTTLLQRVNMIRTAWAKAMTVTSGLRTMEDHIRIYKEKAEKAGVPFDLSKVPMGSRHLTGGAVDISDPKLELTAWLKANPKVLEDAGLWCEEGNANWVHFQISPPKSGNRWFYP
jgi:LAS superfamily LD-carboxypeptidase LdcB